MTCRKYMTGILAGILFAAVPAFSQLTSRISLREYCPTERGQYKSTCFAYAPVYTALSIMENKKIERKDEAQKASHAFSDSYVASRLNKTNGLWVRTISCCGYNGTYLKALEFLKVNGTCRINEFKKKCVKSTRKIKKTDQGTLYKIKSYEVYENVYRHIYKSNGDKDNYSSKDWITSKLDMHIPVIIALQQLPSLLNLKTDNWTPTEAEKKRVKDSCAANHVICIIGYATDPNGNIYFELRNNYKDWGAHDYAYAKADDFLLFVEEAGVMELN